MAPKQEIGVLYSCCKNDRFLLSEHTTVYGGFMFLTPFLRSGAICRHQFAFNERWINNPMKRKFCTLPSQGAVPPHTLARQIEIFSISMRHKLSPAEKKEFKALMDRANIMEDNLKRLNLRVQGLTRFNTEVINDGKFQIENNYEMT